MKKSHQTVARRGRIPTKKTAALAGGEKRDLNPMATEWFFLSPMLKKFFQHGSKSFKNHPWVYAAISRIVSNIIQVPWNIRTGSRKDPQTLENGPWVDLFERINPRMDPQQYFEVILCHLKLSGTCKIVKEPQGNARIRPGEIPFELWPMNGRLFQPLVDKETNNLIGWDFIDPHSGKKIPYGLHEIIEIKYPDPDDALGAHAPMDALLDTARSDQKARAFNEAFFDNDATSGGVYKVPRMLSPGEREAFFKRDDDNYAGYTKAFRTKLLEGNIDFIPNAGTHKDMQFQEQVAWDRDEILAVFGVPKSEVGLEQPTNMVTGAGNVSTNVRFWTGTLLPIMSRIESAHYRHLFKDASHAAVWGEFDKSQIEALKPNMSLLADVGLKLRQLGYSTNEINEKLQLGMPEIEGGDLHFLPAGMMAVEDIGMDQETGDPLEDPKSSTPAADDKDDQLKEESIEIGNLVRDNLQTIDFLRELYDLPPATELDRGHAIHAVKSFYRARPTKRLKQWADVMRKSVLPFEPRFRGRLKRYFFMLRNEQIKRVAKLDLQKAAAVISKLAIGEDHEYTSALVALLDGQPNGWNETDIQDVRDTVEEVLFPLGDWNGTMKSMHHGLYMQITSNAYDKVFQELGGSFAFDESDPSVVDLVAQREESLVKANVTIRRRMAREIEEGVRAGETISQIQDRIKAAFQGFSAARSLRIARTEVSGATNQVRYDAMETEGVDKQQWITAGDEAVRESHEAQDGDVVRIGERFKNGLLHPNDPAGTPEEVINCRCVAVASE